ncbi:MAG: hypothetical protein ABIQ56_01430 [Chitinophagaceae bacterium]
MKPGQQFYPRSFMARCIYAWLFLILVYFFLNHSLLYQLSLPPLIYIGTDNTFWLFHLFGLPQFLLQHSGAALAFDVILTTSCLAFVFIPDRTILAWISVAGCWILYISYCSAAGHQFAQIGYLLIPLAFLVKDEAKFKLMWKLIRYWVCFLYFCGGVYKIYYGGFAFDDNMAEILRAMNAEWLFLRPEGWRSETIAYLIDHKAMAQGLYQLATILDLLMVIGFFTYRFDRWLLISLVIFHFSNYFLLHISFVEQSLIFAPFLPWQAIASRIVNPNHNDRSR